MLLPLYSQMYFHDWTKQKLIKYIVKYDPSYIEVQGKLWSRSKMQLRLLLTTIIYKKTGKK